MKRISTLLVSLCTLFGSVVAFVPEAEERPHEELRFLIDADFGMAMGADNFYTGHVLVKRLDDYVTYWSFMRRDDWLGITGRGLKAILWDQMGYSYFVCTVQHEIFGHGARLRELGIDPTYSVQAPFPFGWGGGATFFSTAEFATLSPQERAAVLTGGVESTEIFARRMFHRAFDKGVWDHRDAILFLTTLHDQTGYIWSLRDEDSTTSSGHDIEGYIQQVNDYCGSVDLKKGDLKLWALINWIDMPSWIAATQAGRYIWYGAVVHDLNGFEIGDFEFMPGLRLTLAPYGPECGGQSYFRFREMPGFVYVRTGKNCGVRTYGGGIELHNIVQIYEVNLGARFDIWSQPNIRNAVWSSKTQIGVLVSLLATYQIDERWSLYCEAGGKSGGFVPGERLRNGPILRVGAEFGQF